MKIKLLQWNIFYKENIKNIVETIKKINPDIICLQELGINSKYNGSIPNIPKYIGEQLGYNVFFKEAQRWEKGLENMDAQGNGIFTRFPIIKTSNKYVQDQSKKTANYSHEGRIYIESDLQIDDKILTVGTTHLSYADRFKITVGKRKEVDKLIKIVKNKKENFIFAADLNSTPASYTVKQLSKYFQNLSPSYNQKTWTTKSFEYHGFKEDKLNWRLDYIFATKDIKKLSSKIIKTKYSDHLPIIVDINI